MYVVVLSSRLQVRLYYTSVYVKPFTFFVRSNIKRVTLNPTVLAEFETSINSWDKSLPFQQCGKYCLRSVLLHRPTTKSQFQKQTKNWKKNLLRSLMECISCILFSNTLLFTFVHNQWLSWYQFLKKGCFGCNTLLCTRDNYIIYLIFQRITTDSYLFKMRSYSISLSLDKKWCFLNTLIVVLKLDIFSSEIIIDYPCTDVY